MHANSESEGLAVSPPVPRAAEVRQWYMQNGLQLSPDKSEALMIGTPYRLPRRPCRLSSVSVAGIDLPVADEMKVLGVVLDRHLTFDNHGPSVATGEGTAQLSPPGHPT